MVDNTPTPDLTIALCSVHWSGFNWTNGPLRCDAYRLMATPGYHHGIEDCREVKLREEREPEYIYSDGRWLWSVTTQANARVFVEEVSDEDRHS